MMRNLYFITVLLFVFFSVSKSFAQEKTSDMSKIEFVENQQGHTAFGDKIIQLDSLNRRISERENFIKKNKPAKQVDLLRLSLSDKDTIIQIINDSIVELANNINSNEAELKIIRFFKAEDGSIFNSNFKVFSFTEIPFCLRNHYQLITDIHDLDSVLLAIRQKIEKLESEEYIKNLPVTSKIDVLKSAIKKDLDWADSLIGKIDERDKSGLYPNQAIYYRPFLIKKFNGFLDKISPHE